MRAAFWQRPRGSVDPGRLDDHPAVRQERLPLPGAHAHPQGQGGFIVAQAGQPRQSKDEILQGYLNTIYFGRGAYGIQAAAQAYFGKDAKDLTVAGGGVLASVLNSPTALDPDRGAPPSALLGRYNYVLDGMVADGQR